MYSVYTQPTIHDHHVEQVKLEFQDLPYTEWISQRWTYNSEPYADWPTLPSDIDEIHQMVEGEMDGRGGLWLLTPSQLYFVRGLNGGPPTGVEVFNISKTMDLSVTPESYLAPMLAFSFFLITPDNITYIDCSKLE